MLRLGWFRCAVLLGTFLILADSRGIGATNADQTATTTNTSEQTLKTKKVKFTTEDDIEIHGSYTPAELKENEKGAIAILLPMYKHDRSSYDPLVPYLHDAGFAVLALDLRGQGESVGPPAMKLPDLVADRDPKLFRDMHKDVAAAYLWLADQPEVDLARFVLVGASIGCSIALDYAGQDLSVDGVVCMTPGTNYLGINSVRSVKKYGRRPLLLLASSSEKADAEKLGKLTPSAEVKIIPGGDGEPNALHGTKMFGQVAGIEEAITEFLVEAAGPPTTEPVVASKKSNVYHQPDSGTVRLIKKENLRWFSSPAEADSRGLRPPKSRSRKK